MAYNFASASSQYITVGTKPSDTLPYTIAAFAYPNQTNVTMSVIGWGLSTDGAAGLYKIRYISTGVIRNQYSSGSTAANTTATYNANTWSHAAGGVASTSSRTIFLDGANKVTDTASGSAISTDNFHIGVHVRTGPTLVDLFNGRIAETAAWSATLTDAEIVSLSKGFKPYRIRPQSLLFYAPLLRNLADLRAGVTLTNNNAATVANHPRVY